MIEEHAYPVERQSALAIIEDYCGWCPIPQRVDSLRLDAPAGRLVQLPSLRLLRVLSVKDCGTEVTKLVEWSTNGLLFLKKGFSGKLGGLEVEIEHGWNEKDKADIAAVIKQLEDRISTPASNVASKVAGPYAIRFANVGGVPVSGAMLLSTEKDILNKYRLVWGP